MTLVFVLFGSIGLTALGAAALLSTKLSGKGRRTGNERPKPPTFESLRPPRQSPAGRV